MGTKTVIIQTKQSGTKPVDSEPAVTPFDDFDPDGDLCITRAAEGSVSTAPTNFMWLGVKVFCSIEVRCRRDQFKAASQAAIGAAVAEVHDDVEWIAPLWGRKSDEIKAALEAKWQKQKTGS